MIETILKFLNENSDALGLVFGSGIIVAISGGVYRIIVWIIKENRTRKIRASDNFSLRIIHPNSNIAKEILGGDDLDPLADRNIPYQQRVKDKNIRREIEDLLYSNRWVLITGKTGLGKTREAINVAESLSKEGWTILYLTREKWLSPPPTLPKGVPERKLLFFLDDLNRKMYASRIEQAPYHTKDNLMQPLTIPLQERLYQTLKIFETLCGKQEILVLGTARDEQYSEFDDEPSEWEKLEISKYDNFWKMFSLFPLPEAEDTAEIALLTAITSKHNIKAKTSEFLDIAKRNDGTFANIVENLRNASNKNDYLSVSTFRETLKGTWDERFGDAIAKNHFVIYFYDAVELIRDVGLRLTFNNVYSVAVAIADKESSRFRFIRNRLLLRDLSKTENILDPRDGQIEAKNYRIDKVKYLPKIYIQITREYYSINWPPLKRFLYFYLIVPIIPKVFILNDNNSIIGSLIKVFLPVSVALNNIGVAYRHYGFYDFAIVFHNKSLDSKKYSFWNISLREESDTGYLNWFNLGRNYLLQRQYENAISAYKNAIKFRPKSLNAINELGIAFVHLGELDNAIDAFKNLVTINSAEDFHWYNLAYSYSIQERYEEALEIYQIAIEKIPDSKLLRFRLASALYKVGRKDEALQHISALRQYIQECDIYTRAAYEAVCGNTTDSIELLKKALQDKIVSAKWVRNDSDFDTINETPEYKELVGNENKI